MARLIVDNVDKTYFGGYVALKNISLTLDSGEVLTVFGKKGAGKSTLLKLISTLEKPTSGTITVDGKDILTTPLETLNISFATYDLPLMNTKSVYANLAYPLRIRKVSEDAIKRRVLDIATLFDIDSILDEHVRYLNDALRARIIVARAFMRESDFYLFDNILEKFGLEERDEVLTLLSLITSHVKGGIIYATNRLEEVTMLGGDNTIILSHGEAVDKGDIANIYSNPSTLDTARLLSDGAVNEYVRVVHKDDIGAYIDLFGKKYIDIDDVYIDKEIVAMVMPEDVILTSCDDVNKDYQGIVTKVYRGTLDTTLLVNTMDEESVVKVKDNSIKAGMDVGLDARNIRLFDIRAERRIISN